MPAPTIIGLSAPALTAKSIRQDIYGVEYGGFSFIGKTADITAAQNSTIIGSAPSLVGTTGLVYGVEVKTANGGLEQIDYQTARIKEAKAILKEYPLPNVDDYCLINKRTEVSFAASSPTPTAGQGPTTILGVPVTGPTQQQISAFNTAEKNKKRDEAKARFGTLIAGDKPISYSFKYRVYEGYKLASFSSNTIVPGAVFISTALYSDVFKIETEYNVLMPPASPPPPPP